MTTPAVRDRELARAGRDLRHDAARRQPARGHLADRRRQAAHRRAARLARRRLHRGRLAGRQPEGRRVLPARAVGARARHEHARRVRLDPPGEGQGRLRRHAAPPARGRHVDGVHRRQGVGLPRARGAAARRSTRAWRWSPTRSRSCAPTAATCSSTPSTSSTATSATPSSRLRVLEGAAQAGATRLVLCDTNGGTLPARGRAHRRARSSTTSAATSAIARAPPRRRRHRRGQRAGRRARRRDPGAGHDQRLRRAHRQLQPHHDHPEPHAEDGHRDDPRRPARAAHARRAPRRRAREHGAQPAGGLRRARRRSRTRRACT